MPWVLIFKHDSTCIYVYRPVLYLNIITLFNADNINHWVTTWQSTSEKDGKINHGSELFELLITYVSIGFNGS